MSLLLKANNPLYSWFSQIHAGQSAFHLSLKQLALYVTYALVMVAGYFVSINLEAIPGSTSWHLPAGIRICAFLFLDKKYWPTLLLSELTLFTALTYHLSGREFTFSPAFFAQHFLFNAHIVAALVTMLGLFWVDKKQLLSRSVESTAKLILLLLTLTAAQSLISMLVRYQLGSYTLAQSQELFIGFWIGDFIGCTIFFAALFVFANLLRLKGALSQLASTVLLFATLVFITLSLSATTGNISAFDSLKANNQQLCKVVQDLESSNSQKARAIDETRRLAKQLSSAKEQERKNLAKELHDDVGQEIIGLKTELRLGKKLGIQSDFLSSMGAQVDQIYTSVHQILFQLQPKELTDVGLAAVLNSQRFYALLNKNGIDYQPQIASDIELTEQQSIELFRICQEAISNIIKYSSATLCRVALSSLQNGVQLRIYDNTMVQA